MKQPKRSKSEGITYYCEECGRVIHWGGCPFCGCGECCCECPPEVVEDFLGESDYL